MNKCRTSDPSYQKLNNFHDPVITTDEIEANKKAAVEKLDELFIWSDDKKELANIANDMIEFDDNLKDILIDMVVKSIGTQELPKPLVGKLYLQIQVTARNYAIFNMGEE